MYSTARSITAYVHLPTPPTVCLPGRQSATTEPSKMLDKRIIQDLCRDDDVVLPGPSPYVSLPLSVPLFEPVRRIWNRRRGISSLVTTGRTRDSSTTFGSLLRASRRRLRKSITGRETREGTDNDASVIDDFWKSLEVNFCRTILPVVVSQVVARC